LLLDRTVELIQVKCRTPMRGKHPNFIYNVDDDHAREMKAQGLGATAIAKALGIGQASVLAGVRNQLR
jgi:hypothetical protein